MFAGGWTLEAAEAVCTGGGTEASDVLDLLAQLVDKSLVVAQTHGGEARYQLLETVREYARERLHESEAVEQVQRRHRDWYLVLAEQVEPKLDEREREIWLDRLERENDNLLASLDWSFEHRDADAVMRLAKSLEPFWRIRGYYSEGLHWLEAALSAVPTLVQQGKDGVGRAPAAVNAHLPPAGVPAITVLVLALTAAACSRAGGTPLSHAIPTTPPPPRITPTFMGTPSCAPFLQRAPKRASCRTCESSAAALCEMHR